MKKFLFLVVLVFNTNIFAEVLDELSVGIGISSVSFDENEPTTIGENVFEPESGSYSVISTFVDYQFYSQEKISISAVGSFPLITSDGTSFFSTGFVGKYYLSDENTYVKSRSKNFTIKVRPKLRYYLSAGLGASYLTYATTSDLKNDFNVLLSLGGGATYAVYKDYAIKGDLLISRGSGTIANTLVIQAMFSGVVFTF